MITFTLSITEILVLVITLFVSQKMSQQGGIAYAEGRNWMPETLASAVLLYACIGFMAFNIGGPTQ